MHIISLFFTPILLLKKISPIILPIRGLTKKNNNEWEAVDNDPQFIVKSRLLKILSGWVTINIKITSNKVMNPKLYFDFGEGYSEGRSLHLKLKENNIYSADYLLSSPLKGIRFDPNDIPCKFTISMFNIKPNSKLLYIIQQLISIMKHDYRNQTDTLRIMKKSYARYRKHGLTGMIERLEKEYKKIHPFKLHRGTKAYIAYLNWMRENEKNTNEIFNEDLFNLTPTISIIMATYNTPIGYLEKAINSVINQSYPNWELCIADDASTNEDVILLLDEYRNKETRIKINFRECNGNRSKAFNSALDLVKGDYVVLMEHDDMLAPNALLEVVKIINKNPDVKLIYSDEDKIDEHDRRYDPYFKSGWNPDMFYSCNYILHLSVIKKSIFNDIGKFREGYENAQDYDLLLRIVKSISGDEIVHIEKILYHWRAYEGSTVYLYEGNKKRSEAGMKALKDHFSNNKNVKVDHGLVPNTYKVSYPFKEEPLVTLIIPTRDRYEILSVCVESIINKTNYKNYEILIIDNQSQDVQTLDYLKKLTKKYNNIRILQYNKPFNYSAINNFAVEYSKGDIIGLINNDIEVISSHWLTEMVQHALRPDIGAVGAKLYYDDNTIQHAGVILIGGAAGHAHKHFQKDDSGYFYRLKVIQNFSAVTAACLVVRKELYIKAGGLEEKHLTVAFNDVDFCLRLQKLGYRNLWTPFVELYHHESISRGAEDTEEKKLRAQREISYLYQTWSHEINNDRYYNINLTNTQENFGIKEHNIYG